MLSTVFNIHFTYSPWWIIAIVIMAWAGTYILYRQQSQNTYSKWQILLLGSLRFLAFLLLGTGLLKPYFTYEKELIQKPTIAILQDMSASMQGQDSSANAALLKQLSQSLEDNIRADFELKKLAFHHWIPLNESLCSLNGDGTDIGKALQYTYDKYSLHNLQAIVLLSDGQHTVGSSPRSIAQQYSIPVFPIAFGDTTTHSGIKLQNLFYNEHSREGSLFPVEAEIQATDLKGKQIRTELYAKGTRIAYKTQSVTAERSSLSAKFELKAQTPGLQKYQLKISCTDEQSATIDKTFYVNISPSEEGILLLGHHPHPDLNAIASALRSQEGRTVEVYTLKQAPQDLSPYKMVILHGLPSTDKSSEVILQKLKNTTPALWIICTPTTYFNRLNKLQNVWQFPHDITTFRPQTVMWQKDFSLFLLPKTLDTKPLSTLWYPQANIKTTKHSLPLLENTKGKALISFAYQGRQKLCLWQAYGLWKWRLRSYKTEGNHRNFNTLINKTADFLLSGKQQKLFQLQHHLVYDQREPIVLKAHLMNANMEAVSDAEIEITLKDSQNKTYIFAFSPEDEGTYSLDLSRLSAEAYTYTAKVLNTPTSIETTGHFAIQSNSKETQNKEANLSLLQDIAQQQGGKVFFPSETEMLAKMLNNTPHIKAHFQHVEQIAQWIEVYWFLMSSLICVGLEWVLKKFWGGY